MSGRWSSVRARHLFAPVAVGLSLCGCGSRVVDAVDLRQTADGGEPFMWPNPTHSANSDPWLVTNHDAIVQMRPNLLVLDFYNAWPVSTGQAQARVQSRIDALAAASAYHAYSDPNAQSFLQYNLVSIIDLTNNPPPANWSNLSSTNLPVDATGAYDMTQLFGSSYVSYFGGHTLCELFELGIVNEVWLLTGEENPPRRPPLLAESRQVYDAQNHAIAGMFLTSTGYAPYVGPTCKVTARIASISATRGVDCDLVPRWLGMENMRQAIPYLQSNASDFFNDDFKAKFNAPFDSWAALLGMGTGTWCMNSTSPCISYPNGTTAQGTLPDGTAWTISGFIQGCGTAHFPPNAQFMWDYTGTQAIQSRCEHYAMHDGLGGSDVTTAYASSTVAAYQAQFMTDFENGGCGAGWQLYLPQSMPGLRNQAVAADGTAMKNWWPFLFY